MDVDSLVTSSEAPAARMPAISVRLSAGKRSASPAA